MRTLIKIFVFCKCSSSQESCGGLVPDGNGLIRSPSSSVNPSIYADNLDCRWLLGQGKGSRNKKNIQVRITSLIKSLIQLY